MILMEVNDYFDLIINALVSNLCKLQACLSIVLIRFSMILCFK